ncbi:hypothetical protein CYMTET_21450, partial [Cymbomonas tetramitiformis]
VNANAKLTLSATVDTDDPETLALKWEARPEGGEAAPLDLGLAASTPLSGLTLVVRADSLVPGAAYLFRLAASDRNGEAAAALRLEVNQPPLGGSVQAAPNEGLALNTTFAFVTSDWTDEDLPLWYSWRYQVAGAEREASLTEMTVSNTEYTTVLPVEGVETEGFVVRLIVVVQDALGAQASAEQGLIVRALELSGTEQARFVDDLLAQSEALLKNGNTEATATLVDGVTATLASPSAPAAVDPAAGGGEAEMGEEEIEKRKEQRGAAMSMVLDVTSSMAPSTANVAWMAETTQGLVAAPAELDPDTVDRGIALFASLVDDTADPSTDSAITPEAAAAMCMGLSSLSQAGGVDSGARARETSAVLESMGSSMLSNIADGEEPQEVASETLTLLVSRADTRDPSLAMFAEPVVGPGGSAVSLPASLGGELGVESLALQLVTCTIEPHPLNSSNASLSAGTTSISLFDAAGGKLQARRLHEAINFSIPLTDTPPLDAEAGSDAPLVPPVQCAFWDQDRSGYFTEGCAALPNPAPRSCRWCGALATRARSRCWWRWESEVFHGPGCVWAASAECLCTHLTDFKALQQQEVGSAEPPPGAVISGDDMTSLSADDVLKSALLLGVLGALIGSGVLLAWLSNMQFQMLKQRNVRALMKSHGTGAMWLKVHNGVWTWSLGEEIRQTGLLSAKEQKQLLAGNRLHRFATSAHARTKKTGAPETDQTGVMAEPPAGKVPAAHVKSEPSLHSRYPDNPFAEQVLQSAMLGRATYQRNIPMFSHLLDSQALFGETSQAYMDCSYLPSKYSRHRGFCNVQLTPSSGHPLT